MLNITVVQVIVLIFNRIIIKRERQALFLYLKNPCITSMISNLSQQLGSDVCFSLTVCTSWICKTPNSWYLKRYITSWRYAQRLLSCWFTQKLFKPLFFGNVPRYFTITLEVIKSTCRLCLNELYCLICWQILWHL